MNLRVICRAALVVLAGAMCVSAQTAPAPATAAPLPPQPTIKQVPAAYTNPASGKEMYNSYCASCHGTNGKGNGPAAPALKMPATDLTTLAAKNGGTFPAEHVAAVIQGDAMTPAHGSKEMPIWGPIFMSIGGHSQAQVQLRVRNLTKYLESLQVK